MAYAGRGMQWSSVISTKAVGREALDEAAAGIDQALSGHPPQLVVAFASPHHGALYEHLPTALTERFPDSTIMGCSGGGVIGGGHEVESEPALSLTAAVLPGVSLSPFFVSPEDLTSLE